MGGPRFDVPLLFATFSHPGLWGRGRFANFETNLNLGAITFKLISQPERLNMTLLDYLRERHKTVNALTLAEAKVVGIDYPLQKGWVEKYGSLELPDEIVDKLRAARKQRYSQKSYKKQKSKSAKRGYIAKPEKKPNQTMIREKSTKKDKRDRKDSLTKLVKTIFHAGCKDAKRLEEYLNKPHRSALHKEHAKNMAHMKSI
jgi:hypothetical protein